MRSFAFLGAVFAGLGVVFGAFGAHVLKQSFTPDNLQTFITGTNYQLIHGMALLVLVALTEKLSCDHRAAVTGWLFVVGIVLFSGSLYALSLTGVKAFGMVAPLGGLSLIAGWIVFAFNAWGMQKPTQRSEL